MQWELQGLGDAASDPGGAWLQQSRVSREGIDSEVFGPRTRGSGLHGLREKEGKASLGIEEVDLGLSKSHDFTGPTARGMDGV